MPVSKDYVTVGERVGEAARVHAEKKLHKPSAKVKERMGLRFQNSAGEMPSHRPADFSVSAEKMGKGLFILYFAVWTAARVLAWVAGWAGTHDKPPPEACGWAAIGLTGCAAAGLFLGRVVTEAFLFFALKLVPLPSAIIGGRVEPEMWRGPMHSISGSTTALASAAVATYVAFEYGAMVVEEFYDWLATPQLWLAGVSQATSTSTPSYVVMNNTSPSFDDGIAHQLPYLTCGTTFVLGALFSRSITDSAPKPGSVGKVFWSMSAVLVAIASSGHVGEDAATALCWLGWIALAYRRQFKLDALPSKETFTNASAHFQAIRRKQFPPPYPNGWYRLCNSVDVDDGNIKSISALGRHFVAFRGEDGKAGVLHAFCPHIGAHLGAGCVRGNGLQCPFHHWTFDRTGKCIRMPSSRAPEPKGDALIQRSRAKAYECREHLGMIFVWFHAEDAPPQWEMKYHKDCADTTKMYMGAMCQLTMDQHVCEMSENSADYFHFQTLHRPMPLPGVGRLLAGRHAAHALYPQDRDDDEKHCALFEEEMQDLYLLDTYKIGFMSGRTGGAKVLFEGPGIVHFEIQAIPSFLGRLRMIKTILPVEPFKLNVETRWFAEWAPPHFVSLLASVAVGGLEQDREVWETKIYRKEPRLSDGDGPYRAYREWWWDFYSEHSSEMDNPDKLDW
eukprot:Hpha_TRINITY_DN16338_c2_g2::TRINITY_DN16338_c2_g2_i1::g.57710::m.57710/K14938/NVD, DAF36; cholesterol 7-desaturase